MTRRRKRTKSQRKKEEKSGYKRAPGVAKENFCALWLKRPCNKGKNYFHYSFSRIRGGSDCKYYNGFLFDSGMCPEYDARYCPPYMDEYDDE